jgi:hypothetical protein
MKTRKTASIFIVICILSSIYSCRKEPGPGGKGSITGKIYEKNYNKEFTTLQGEYFKGDHDVYIQYGSENTYSDKVSSHYDGTFEFDYLLPGDYTVYTYSKDSTLFSPGDIAIIHEVELDNKEDKDLGTITVYED